MRVLIVTKIFPNAAEPEFAPYNVHQFTRLARKCDVTMWAPVPWLPFASRLGRRSRAGVMAGVPRTEQVDNLEVFHPRILHAPKLLGLIGPLYAASLAPRALALKGQVDVILAAFAYPDGFAAIVLGELLDVPVVVKLHGGDVNMVAKLPGPRRNLRWALPRVTRVVAVSEPLAEEVKKLGAPADRVDVVMNGVDHAVFHVRNRSESRAALSRPEDRRSILYVGRLEERKGIFELLEAFTALAAKRSDVDLVLVGDGADTEACRKIAAPLGGRVIFAGAKPVEEVARWMGACDLLTLPSHAEGTPNVLIEALTSGRRVVATRVGGVPDVVTDAKLGEMVPVKDAGALADALGRAVDEPYEPAEVAALGGRGDWTESADQLYASLVRAREEGR